MTAFEASLQDGRSKGSSENPQLSQEHQESQQRLLRMVVLTVANIKLLLRSAATHQA